MKLSETLPKIPVHQGATNYEQAAASFHRYDWLRQITRAWTSPFRPRAFSKLRSHLTSANQIWRKHGNMDEFVLFLERTLQMDNSLD